MLPEIVRIGTYPIHSFGVFVAISFIAGMWWCRREAIRRDFPVLKMMDLTFWLMISGLLGARILFIIVNWSSYAANPSDIFKVWQGGLVWYGGFIGAFLTGLFLIRRYKLPLLGTTDICCTAVPFGHAFGRLGCLAAGDDHGGLIVSALGPKAQEIYKAGLLYMPDGRLTAQAIDTIRMEGFDIPWWSTVLGPRSLVQNDLIGLPLYPAQIAMSLYTLAIFVFLAIYRKYQRFEGELMALSLIIYPICRFILENYRGDVGRGIWLGGLSTSQLISALLLTIGVTLYAVLWKKASRAYAPQS